MILARFGVCHIALTHRDMTYDGANLNWKLATLYKLGKHSIRLDSIVVASQCSFPLCLNLMTFDLLENPLMRAYPLLKHPWPPGESH